MWLIWWLFKTAIDIATIPLDMVADVYDSVTEKNQFKQSKTEKKLEKILEDLDKTFDWDLF